MNDLRVNPDFIPFGLYDLSTRDGSSNDTFRDLIKELSLALEDFGVTNLVKCPIDMYKQHIKNCSYWLKREIDLMGNLSLIVCLGRYAGTYFGVEEWGTLKTLPQNIKALKIYHPSYVRRFKMRAELKKQVEVLKEVIPRTKGPRTR